jgi:hypothetical protein
MELRVLLLREVVVVEAQQALAEEVDLGSSQSNTCYQKLHYLHQPFRPLPRSNLQHLPLMSPTLQI